MARHPSSRYRVSSAPSRDPPPGCDPARSRQAESTQPGASPFGGGGAVRPSSGLGLPRVSPPHRSVRRRGRRWRSVHPADPGAGGSDSRVPHERLFSFPCLPTPRVPGSGRRPAFHEAAGTWRMRGPRVGTRHAAAPSSDLGALPSWTVGGGSTVRRPSHRILGGGAWQPPGECPRRTPKPAPPLTRDSLPLLLWRGGGRGP